MFKVEPVLSSFSDATARLGPAYEVRPPLLDPATGAALYAAKRAGMPLDRAAVLRLGAAVRLFDQN